MMMMMTMGNTYQRPRTPAIYRLLRNFRTVKRVPEIGVFPLEAVRTVRLENSP